MEAPRSLKARGVWKSSQHLFASRPPRIMPADVAPPRPFACVRFPSSLAFVAVVAALCSGAAIVASTAPAPAPLTVALPVVANTWGFVNATAKAWGVIHGGTNSSMDAVIQGCGVCEEEQCDGTVGFGGSPDSTGETTLDAMIMDGTNLDVGSVGYLRRVKNAIGVARAVMLHSTETLIAGEGATAFAVMMGFKEESLATPQSVQVYNDWVAAQCQPNYWYNVENQSTQCPPYTPLPDPPTTTQNQRPATRPSNPFISQYNHDTIGMIAIDASGSVTAGTSTNGANHKIAGRIGDSPIVGAGAYADNTVGAATATGDGDVMMRFLPAYQAVENMRSGMDPTTACESALKRIGSYYPAFQGALLCVNKAGQVGAAGWGWTFVYSLASPSTNGVVTVSVVPIGP